MLLLSIIPWEKGSMQRWDFRIPCMQYLPRILV